MAFDRILAWEGLGFICLVYGCAVFQLIRNRPAVISAGRAQLLIVTAILAGRYMAQVQNTPGEFPEIPGWWFLLLGGSHVIYLMGKYFSMRTET